MNHAAPLAVAEQLAGQYGDMPGVRAVALGGSRAGGLADVRSDIDLYVYADHPPPIGMRAALAGDASQPEIDNRFWETGDEWADPRSGIAIDVTFRSPQWVQEQLDRVLVHHQASAGYSTAVWHNVRTSRLLIDSDGWYSALQSRASVAYPEELRRAIVGKNQPILAQVRGAYRRQIAKALARDDGVSVHHRVTALLESVFDIVFAVNRQTHPGEKRLLEWVELSCPTRPRGFRGDVESLLAVTSGDPATLLESIDRMVAGLDEVLTAQNLLPGSDVPLHHLSAP